MSAAAPFMILFRDSTPEAYDAMPREQLADCLDRWNDWFNGLAAEGRLHHGHPLEPQGRVLTGPRHDQVVDGPFSEAKEAVGGYFLVSAADLDEATEIARQCPLLPHGMIVEVRPVSPVCHLARSLGRATMQG